MVEGVFFGSLGVVLGTDSVEVAIDCERIAPGRSLEDHMLKKVRDARELARLVAAAGLDEEPASDGMGLVVQLGDHAETVIEHSMMKVHLFCLFVDGEGVRSERQNRQVA